MDHQIDENLQPAISLLLEVLARQARESAQAQDMKIVLTKLDRVIELIIHAHRAVMDNIDNETNQISEQLDEIARGMLNDVAMKEQVTRLHKLAETLKGVGKVPQTPATPQPL